MYLFSLSIHPRRIVRGVYRFFHNLPFLLCCRLHRVDFVIGRNSFLKRCSVKTIKGYGKLIIGDNCSIKDTIFRYYDIGGTIVINDRVRINARPDAKTQLSVKGETRIEIDERCLLSNSIDIATTDWHCILDERGERTNLDKDVYIGRHVWIGRKAIIGKGVSIPDNSVIGAGSVVTKAFDERNVIIAGNPARIRKGHVNWK